MLDRRSLNKQALGVVVGAGAWSLATPLALAQAAPKKGGTLNVGLHIPLPTLDWQSTVGHPLPQVMGHVFEGLFALGSDFNAVPELVDSYEASADGTAWTFRLRAGVAFHNGDVLSAKDVKASLERWRKIGPKGSGLNDLAAIEIVDDLSLRLKFNSPMGRYLLLLLGSDENKAVIMPKAVAEASPTAGTLSAVVGTGPYSFVEYREDQFARLKRFAKYSARSDKPNYQGGKKEAHVDEIVFWIVPESSTRVAGLESGDYDIVTEVPDSDNKRLQALPKITPVKNGPGVLVYMMFNHKTGPTSKLGVRRAIQAMVNATEISAAAVSDPAFARSDPSFYPPESAYNTKASAELYNQNNPEKAKKLLAEAGYAGEEVTIQVISTSTLQNRAAVPLVEQAKRAGLNLVIKSYDLATWVAKRRDPTALNIYTSAGYWLDPSLWHAEFNGKFPSPEVGFISEPTEAIFKKLAAATDFETRRALGEDLQRAFYDQVATINLGYMYRLVAHRKEVIDPAGNLALGNLTLHGVWLDR